MIAADEVIQAWCAQLLADDVLRSAVESGRQVEVRLYVANGSIRKAPVIALDAGPNTLQHIS